MSGAEDFETKGMPWNVHSLPSTWALSKLDPLISLLNSGFACGRQQQLNEGLIHLRPMNISSEGRVDLADIRYVPESSGDQRLQANDILFNNTNSPAWVGKTAHISEQHKGLAFSNHMTRIRFKNEISSKFMAHQIDYLRRAGYFAINCNKHVNQASISGDFLRSKTPIIIPPLAEQKRIADKLEAVLGRVEACRTRLDRVPDLLKRFRQSVLAAATSGKLTEAREDGIPNGWKKVPFEDLLADKDKLSYGVLKPGDHDTNGVPMYRVVDIGAWGKRNETERSYISKALSNEFTRTIVEEGDILLSVMATIGRAMVATKDMAGANVNRALAVIKTDRAKVDSSFLMYYFLSPALVTEFEERSLGSAQVRINLGDLRQFLINLPPLAEQTEIVRRVEALFALADQIEARLTEARTHVERLTPATLAKAFRGELVPQDPHDEPASVLLSRIKNEEIGTTPKRREKKPANTLRIRVPKQHAVMSKSRFDDDVKGQPYLANLLRVSSGQVTANELFKEAQLSIVDFYKQLSWEVEQGYVWHNDQVLEAKS